MSLYFELRVTTSSGAPSLGLLEVQRASHRDVADPGADTSCTYSVRLDARDVGTVEHRYGDGPWVLAALAASLVGQHPESGVPRRHTLGVADRCGATTVGPTGAVFGPCVREPRHHPVDFHNPHRDGTGVVWFPR